MVRQKCSGIRRSYLGYEEPSTFSRAFSNQYGLSPTKYREMAKKSHDMNGLSILITEVTRD